MKKYPAYCFAACLLLISTGLFALGKKAEEEKTALNNDWFLCVTNFDISALPESRRTIGEVFNRSLVDTLKVVSYRIRLSPEYAYYEGYAWSQARATAAKNLSAKQDERALLLYRGEPGWKYKRDIKKIDADITGLREVLAKAESEMPLINDGPVFDIIQSNKDGTFPEVPPEGRERRFCMDQKADAFLAGAIREYHSRYYVTLRLYTLYTGTFVYDDEIIFSADDITGAVDEIAGRLTAVLSGSRPAAVAVHAEPADTLVLINRSFAGRGTVAAHDRPPGKISVELSAADHQPETIETELSPGELSDINVKLWPTEYGEVTVLAPGVTGAVVYQGALYAGEAPLTLRLPLNQFNNISVQTPDGQVARAAFVSPAEVSRPYTFSLKPRMPSADPERVNKARRAYYWSWGGTWIAGIAAWIITGMLKSQNEAITEHYALTGAYNQSFYDEATLMHDIYTGAWAVAGAAAAFEIFQMARYIYIATEDTTPVIKPNRQGTAP
jgi:hypothetical protein